MMGCEMKSFPLILYAHEIKGTDTIAQCLGQTLRIQLNDGRFFTGILYMTDDRGHLVLNGEINWPHISSSTIDTQWMGTVAIAPEHICKMELRRSSTSA
jgi:small nuclear ribonucleoprotein (snRNP)-like protein